MSWLVVSALLAVGTGAESVRVAGTVAPPPRTHHVEAAYPPLAGQVGLMGFIILEMGLSAEGRPIDIKIVHGVPLLDVAAVEAVKQWRYQPILIDGKPGPVTFREVVEVFPDADARADYFSRMAKDRKAQKTFRLIAIDSLRSGTSRQKSVLKALRQASEDPDADISDAARRALAVLDGR